MISDTRLPRVIASQPFPLLFVTISGSHLYGFSSADSDYDLRGVHVLPLHDVIGLTEGKEVVSKNEMREGLEIDLVTHDVKKCFQLLLNKNGSMLEQIDSLLVLQTSPEHEELKVIARQCITRHFSHHYMGFSSSQWKLFNRDSPHRVKPLLYIYRVLLTGIHLMRTGEVEPNLLKLNEVFKQSFIPDLVARKLAGPELSVLEDADLAFHEQQYHHLRAELEQAVSESFLPSDAPPEARMALNDLLIRVRLRQDV